MIARAIAGIGAAALVATALVGVAQPASAATYSYAIDCSSSNSVSLSGLSTGDVISITGTNGCNYLSVYDSIISGSGSVTVTGTGGITQTSVGGMAPYQQWQAGTAISAATINVTVSGSGTAQIALQDSNNSYQGTVIRLTLPSPSPSSTSISSGPAAVTQQFGKPFQATCEAAQTEGLNWGGAESGGWGDSWAQWMNEGSGGFICTRTLIYSNSLGHWVVG